MLCDVGPRDGLQNETEVLEPAARAELVNRLAAAGLPRVEAVSFVRDDRCRRWPGRGSRGGDRAARRHRALRPRPQRAGLRAASWRRGSTASTSRSRATETSTSATANASLDEALARGRADPRSASEVPATVTISVAFGCPFEGRVDPGRVAELAARFDGARGRPRGHDRRRRRRTGARRSSSALGAARLPRAQHAQHRLRERARRARSGRDAARRVGRRPRRLPLRAAGDGEHRHRGPRLPARGRGRGDGRRPRRARSRVSEWLEGMLGRRLEG